MARPSGTARVPTPDATIELTLAAHIDLPADVASAVHARARAAAYRLTPRGTPGHHVPWSRRNLLRAADTAPTVARLHVWPGRPRRVHLDTRIGDRRRSSTPVARCSLDVARHFMPKSFILELIDLLALHKCNVLHLHLTDDQGWRIEIEGYPRLTEVGAWRPRVNGTRTGTMTRRRRFVEASTTREDLEEIVAYAAERHVQVLPEIDMPGHMVAAIAAYPALGNTDEHLTVRDTWGISSHVLNLEDEHSAILH